MNLRCVVFVAALVFGFLIGGFDISTFKILEILLLGTVSRLLLKNIPWFEFVTILTVFTGTAFGGLKGAYMGFFIIVLSDTVWYDFSNTLWNAPTFAAIGALSGVIPLNFVLLVGLMTLMYNIVTNTIIVAVYGASPMASILWSVIHVSVNMTVAGYIYPKIVEVFS